MRSFADRIKAYLAQVGPGPWPPTRVEDSAQGHQLALAYSGRERTARPSSVATRTVKDIGTSLMVTCENGKTRVTIGKSKLAAALTEEELRAECDRRKVWRPFHARMDSLSNDELQRECRRRGMTELCISQWADELLLGECKRRGIDTMSTEVQAPLDAETARRISQRPDVVLCDDDLLPVRRIGSKDIEFKEPQVVLKKRDSVTISGITFVKSTEGHCESCDTELCPDEADFCTRCRRAEKTPSAAAAAAPPAPEPKRQMVDLATLADLLAEDA